MNRGMIVVDAFDIETERLRLRPLQESDETLFCEMYTDPEVMQFIAPPLSQERAGRYFQRTLKGMRQQPAKSVWLTIVENCSGQPVGLCGVPQFEPCSPKVEVGILLIGDKRSKGYAREALSKLIDRCFAALGCEEVWVQFSSQSKAVRRLVDSVELLVHEDVQGGKGMQPVLIASIRRA